MQSPGVPAAALELVQGPTSTGAESPAPALGPVITKDQPEVKESDIQNEHSSPTKLIRDHNDKEASELTAQSKDDPEVRGVQIRLLVRRREAGALIGKLGSNIKRLRETFPHSMFSIPDTGNGPERVVCLTTDLKSLEPILTDICNLLLEKSDQKDDQIELKLLIHSSHAGTLIGLGGLTIKKLRNDSKAAIKIYEICCPFSNERVCAIKARVPIVILTLQNILRLTRESPPKGTSKPYDALHFDLNLVDKYGGYLPDELAQMATNPLQYNLANNRYASLHHHFGQNNPVNPQSSQQIRFLNTAYGGGGGGGSSGCQDSIIANTKNYSLWRLPKGQTSYTNNNSKTPNGTQSESLIRREKLSSCEHLMANSTKLGDKSNNHQDFVTNTTNRRHLNPYQPKFRLNHPALLGYGPMVMMMDRSMSRFNPYQFLAPIEAIQHQAAQLDQNPPSINRFRLTLNSSPSTADQYRSMSRYSADACHQLSTNSTCCQARSIERNEQACSCWQPDNQNHFGPTRARLPESFPVVSLMNDSDQNITRPGVDQSSKPGEQGQIDGK